MHITSFRSLAACFAASLIAAPSPSAAQSNSTVLISSGQWNRLQEDVGRCAMETVAVGSPRQTFIIGAPPAEDASVLTIRGNSLEIGKLGKLADAELVIFPSGERFAASMMRFVAPDTHEPNLVMTQLPEAFLERFAAGTALNVEWNGRAYLQLQYSDGARAVADLIACNLALMEEWGLDVAKIAMLKSKPRPLNPGKIYSGEDYPITALQRGEQGTTVIEFTVDVDGRAKDCSIVVSSRSSILDAQSCELMEARAKFSPAIDENGNAVPIRIAQPVKWQFI